jgi:hypothetical protein
MTDFIAKKLKQIDGLSFGTDSVSFHTIGMVQENTVNTYFKDFSFLGPSWGNATHLDRAHSVYDAQAVRHWDDAFVIDKDDHQLVVDSLEMITRRKSRSSNEQYGLFRVDINFTFTQVDTHTDEYLELRKFNALSKLSPDEIVFLGLEQQAVYLKLKYGGDQNDDEVLF